MHALFPSILAILCLVQSMHYLEAGQVSIIISFRIVIIALLAFFFFKEQLDFLQMVGAGLVLWGIILVQERQKPN